MMKKLKSLGTSFPILVASVLNAIFLAFVIFLAAQEVSSELGMVTRWQLFLGSPPNEIGDTLAGIFGSMTLIWIVASVFQQSMELRAQREEFAEMVLAQEAQVLALNAQADIFRDEQKRARHNSASATINNEIRFALRSVVSMRKSALEYNSSGSQAILSKLLTRDIEVNNTSDGYRSNDETFIYVIEALTTSSEINGPSEILDDPKAIAIVERILNEIEKALININEQRPELSKIGMRRLESFGAPTALAAVKNVRDSLAEKQSA